MGRAPCCEKVGLKRGPWTPQEDHVLISFIQRHGHSNWRALPKQAGLLRCGKSCRLRWINYLKPDIKRGKFTKEEEETIIKLHEMIGNRWSAIAARLPGRTDNEIKNVWHTHLKKGLTKHENTKTQKKHCQDHKNVTSTNNSISINNFEEISSSTSDLKATSSQQSYSSDGFSSIIEVSSLEVPYNNVMLVAKDEDVIDSQYSNLDYLSIIDETFWSSEELSIDDYDVSSMLENSIDDNQLQVSILEDDKSNVYNNSQVNYEGNVDFWYNLVFKASEATELTEL